MEPRPGAGAAHTRTRRGFLLGGAVVVAASAGGGVALGLSTSRGGEGHDDPFVTHVPRELIAARDAESALLAAVDAAITSAPPATKQLLRAIRADHAAHLAAIRSSIAISAYPATASPSPTPASPTGEGLSRAGMRAAEARAARVAAGRAARLTGAPAALLASVAASEACHAELLA